MLCLVWSIWFEGKNGLSLLWAPPSPGSMKYLHSVYLAFSMQRCCKISLPIYSFWLFFLHETAAKIVGWNRKPKNGPNMNMIMESLKMKCIQNKQAQLQWKLTTSKYSSSWTTWALSLIDDELISSALFAQFIQPLKGCSCEINHPASKVVNHLHPSKCIKSTPTIAWHSSQNLLVNKSKQASNIHTHTR